MNIAVIGPTSYRVTFSSTGDDLDYIFEVSDDAIPVVSWEPRFRDEMGGLIDPATSLFEALQALHLARRML